MEKKFAQSKQTIKEKKLSDRTKRAVLSALASTYDRDKFIATLKAQGVDVVLRETDTGRIYGATFIDHRTGCVLNGSRMGKELSANALQEHFTLPYAGQAPIPMSVPTEDAEHQSMRTTTETEDYSTGLGLFTPEGTAVDVEEERFIREMQKKKKKKRKGFRL